MFSSCNLLVPTVFSVPISTPSDSVMPEILELLPEDHVEATPLFENEEEYFDFREVFMQEVIPEQEKWLEARMKSEEESRQRLLR